MKLFVLLGAVLVSASAHLFSYDDSSEDGHFTPSFYVSRNPPSGKPGVAPWGRSSYYQPSYYVSKTLPRWPMKPHGTGAVYTYPSGPSYRSDFDLEWSPVPMRSGRSKSKKSQPIKGGWWYKWENGKLITGRWGAPPPPGLEKEHYVYGGNQGGWGWQPKRAHAGWGWGGQLNVHHGHHAPPHKHTGFGGHHFSKTSPHHKPSHHGIGPGFHVSKWGGGGNQYGGGGGGNQGYGGGGGWGWPQPQKQHGWGWGH